MGTLGSYLRELRTAKGMSLEEVSRATRVGRTHLEALEVEELSALPAPVFVKGFIRAYCDFLQTNPAEALSRYQALTGERTPASAPSAPRTAHRRTRAWPGIRQRDPPRGPGGRTLPAQFRPSTRGAARTPPRGITEHPGGLAHPSRDDGPPARDGHHVLRSLGAGRARARRGPEHRASDSPGGRGPGADAGAHAGPAPSRREGHRAHVGARPDGRGTLRR